MERDSLFLTATVLIMAIVAAAMAIDNSRAYPFKSAIITYRIS